MRTCIVIPARLKSTRLPEKLLLCETGQTLLQHTFEAAAKSQIAEQVFVATDSQQIVDVVEGFGGQAILTDANHQSGTDRIAEFAESHPEFELLVNVQGDEPEIKAASIDAVIELLQSDAEAAVATLACPLTDWRLLGDPSCVKVVLDKNRNALYFSRSKIPFNRDNENVTTDHHLQHVGIYAYRRDFLLLISRLPLGQLEQIEKLEQLRFLEAGHSIKVATVDSTAPGIDTAEDYAAFVRRINSC